MGAGRGRVRRREAAGGARWGIRAAAVAADGAQLRELVELVDAGVLTTRVAATYPLEEAVKAHTRLAEGGVRGRLVLLP
ncbi:hypothetical protein GCM10010344_04280 [Streptomyces bluensis]|nr:hypothetical protein GCM10010344_04280 [Streptomyces bluensis]